MDKEAEEDEIIDRLKRTQSEREMDKFILDIELSKSMLEEMAKSMHINKIIYENMKIMFRGEK